MSAYQEFDRKLDRSLRQQGYDFKRLMVLDHLKLRVALYSDLGVSYSLHFKWSWRHCRYEVGDKTLSGKFIRKTPEEINRILNTTCAA
jgi:hypothetical protein